jgi:protoporphyrin/coproporphyrin ferrochelatase
MPAHTDMTVPSEVAVGPDTTGDPYDAILLVSFGGPEGPDDVVPFLENVTRGRGIPPERLAEVGAHYALFGGVSPINEQCRALVAALEHELATNGPQLPVYWGNRNWHPLLTDTVRRMRDDGVHRALAFVTSAYSSYSACRQYLDDIERARVAVGDGAPRIDKIRQYYDHPGFIGPMARNVGDALASLPIDRRSGARVVATAHSVPASMAATSDYVAQMHEAARLVAERGAPGHQVDLVWQSRSGPPGVPWLEPDVGDHLEMLAAQGVAAAVVAPIGFVSDHMEVVYDLDTVAAERARACGIVTARAATVGTDPDFVSMIRELVLERIDPSRPRRSLGGLGVRPDVCPVGCCPPPHRERRATIPDAGPASL